MRRYLESTLRKLINYHFLMKVNVINEIIAISVNESVDFVKVLSKNHKFELFSSRTKIQEYSVELLIQQNKNSTENMTMLEFGTFKGASLLYFCRKLPNYSVVGFDTFRGLSESFGGINSATFFNRKGKLPKFLPKNADLVVGDCTQTVSEYLIDSNPGEIVAVHFDLDVYGATKLVMGKLKPYLVPGTYILFDEMFGNPFWQGGEFAALNEVYTIAEFDWIAFGPNQALIQLK